MGMILILAFISGVTTVLSRTLNAKLSESIGSKSSTLVNYIVGFSGALLFFLVTGAKINHPAQPLTVRDLPYFSGGLLGVIVVFLAILLVPRLPAYSMTLLLFLGQLFSGIAFDFFKTGTLSTGKLIGGILITIGLFISNPPKRKSLDRQSAT